MTSAFTPPRSSCQMSLGAEALRIFEVLGNSNNDETEGSLLGWWPTRKQLLEVDK